MTDSNIFKLNKPEQNNPLQEVNRLGIAGDSIS